MAVDLLILTPARGSPDSLEQLIDSITKDLSVGRGYSFLHVVADNHSDNWQGYAELVEKWHALDYPLAYNGCQPFGTSLSTCEVWTFLFSAAKWQQFKYAIWLPEKARRNIRPLNAIIKDFDFLRKIDNRVLAQHIEGPGFIAVKRFFQVLRFAIKPVIDDNDAEVFKQIERRLAEENCSIATQWGS